MSLSMVKAMLMLIKMTEVDSSDSARGNPTMDYPSDLFQIDACTNVSCTLPGVVLLVSMVRLGKLLYTFL